MKHMLLSLLAVSFLMAGCNVEIGKEKPKPSREEDNSSKGEEAPTKNGE